MEQKKPSQSELQSKTLILGEVEGIDDMLAGLNQGRAQLEKPKKTRDWKTIIIVVLLVVVLVEILWLVIR
ncbi:MAG TPA: hypothetical protein PLV42_05025 [bacterium]|nr:hypothetical protein [bacterium]